MNDKVKELLETWTYENVILAISLISPSSPKELERILEKDYLLLKTYITLEGDDYPGVDRWYLWKNHSKQSGYLIPNKLLGL